MPESICLQESPAVAGVSLWGYVTSHEASLGFAFAVGALFVAGQALRSQRYGFVAVFAAITLIYCNQVVAAFPRTGGLPFLFPLVFLTVLAFAAPLIWLHDQPAEDPRGPSDLKEGSLVKTGLSAWENEGGAPVPPELDLATEEPKGEAKQFLRLTEDEGQCGVDKTS